jgi:Cu(I)/Ag(I) efflux system membrane protein CusA/SilA
VYAERELGGFFLDFTPDREAIARYGLTVRDVLDVVESSIGGMDVDTTIEGRERYRVNIRYPRETRDNLEALRAVLVPIPRLLPRALPTGGGGTASPGSTGAGMSSAPMSGGSTPGGMGGGGQVTAAALVNTLGLPGSGNSSGMQGSMSGGITAAPQAGREPVAFVPLGQVARIEPVMGPPMIKSEMGSLTGWVYVDIEDRDVGSYVSAAKQAVASALDLPPGYRLKWTGQYELLERVRARLAYILPLTLGLVFVILYLNFRGLAQTLIVMSGVPFAAVGAIWLLYAVSFNTSIAVWVGMIALLGVAAETTSVMVVYLDQAWRRVALPEPFATCAR